jgi:glutamate-1-semialdehyde 2,1-aminomutase
VASESDRLFTRACAVIPGGVNSPVRSWRAVGGNPAFIARGEGPFVIDVDGRRYLDFVASWGPLVLGHAHPAVVRAITERAREGTSFGAPTPLEVDLAALLVDALPGVEQVRLVSSGTEATMSALRLARAAVGRERILKFVGCYHGHVDGLLVRAGSGALTLGVPDSPGVPPAIADLTLLAAYNDVSGTRDVIRRHAAELAAVIVEPVAGNMGVVPPAPGFLEMLREETERADALLVFDEVITGFRLGWSGAQGRFGIRPDLTCLGKIVGGGMPLAAFGGRRDLMAQVAPAGPVYQAGTLSWNPVCVAADTERFARFFRGMIAEGVYLPPSQFEAMFVSLAHDESHVERLGAAAKKVLAGL